MTSIGDPSCPLSDVPQLASGVDANGTHDGVAERARLSTVEVRVDSDTSGDAVRAAPGLDVALLKRYIRSPDDPEEAELAVLVVDDWQRRGVATALLAELSTHAAAHGVKRYRAIVSRENTSVIAALRRMGAVPHPHDGELHCLLPVATTARILAR